ncbi:MAG: DUF3352 domain-containing protein, partial [Cyanobacteria bacterium J06649_4]
KDLLQLESALSSVGISSAVLPKFLRVQQGDERGQMISSPENSSLENSLLWEWVSEEYALAQVSRDWVLAVNRDPEGLDKVDQAAQKAGYSAVPVVIGEQSATAWTRFKAKSGRTGGLETELMGLHMQQGEYELFASSLAAMDSALAASNESLPNSSLLNEERFTQAIAPLPPSLKADSLAAVALGLRLRLRPLSLQPHLRLQRLQPLS